jgi:hypothetical protein
MLDGDLVLSGGFRLLEFWQITKDGLIYAIDEPLVHSSSGTGGGYALPTEWMS